MQEYECVKVHNNPDLWLYDTLWELRKDGVLSLRECAEITKDWDVRE